MFKLGLPSKGRIQAQTIDWFADRGIAIERDPDGREYSARALGIERVAPVMLSAGEIPRELAAGRIHAGITGEDLIRDRVHDWERRVILARQLGFGDADLVVAVPDFWVDVETLADLDEVAAGFRDRHGHALRIATKYHVLTRQFLRQHGVADYRIVDSQGATEGAPLNRSAEAIVDITSSGETLRANHLRVLEDGLILHSEANLCISRSAPWDDATRGALAELATRCGLGAVPQV